MPIFQGQVRWDDLMGSPDVGRCWGEQLLDYAGDQALAGRAPAHHVHLNAG